VELKRTIPSRSLLQGMPYTNKDHTDIRRLFDRVRAEQQAAKPTNVKPMRKAAK
jgi:hypothetical protein